MQLTSSQHGPWEGIKDDGGPKVYWTRTYCIVGTRPSFGAANRADRAP